MVKYWEQPKITEDGVMGGDSFAVASSSNVWADTAHAWQAFVGATWHGSSQLPAWLAWYNPEPLRVEIVRIQNRNATPGNVCAPTKYKVQASNNGVEWTDLTSLITNTVTASDAWQPDINIPVSNQGYYQYYRLYITASTDSYTAIQSIKIVAPIINYNSESHPRYWVGWEQPIIMSNTDYGQITASSYAPNCYPYRAVQNNHMFKQAYGWATDGLSKGWWRWDFPEKLKINQLIFINRTSDTEDASIVFQEGRFSWEGGILGDPFKVDKSREIVVIPGNGFRTSFIEFNKIGGIYSGIGELLIDAEVQTSAVGRAFADSIKAVYSEGKECVKLYSYGKLLWSK